MPGRIIRDGAILSIAVAFAIAIRLFGVSISVIPSESMLPGLWVGDYLLVAKWPYGWSGDGGPLARHLWNGRFAPRDPKTGDVVVFKAPPAGQVDYIKRVIGLPGDRVALRRGIVILNGQSVVRRRIDDLILPESANSPCRPQPGADIARIVRDRRAACRYTRYRETLPGGRTYDVLDLGPTDADDFGPITVPQGRMFVLGDNRDRSADSRFPARDGGAVGLVPLDALVGRPILTLFSTDGDARATDPLSWWRALRWGRTARAL